jgi:hypothetical protein
MLAVCGTLLRVVDFVLLSFKLLMVCKVDGYIFGLLTSEIMPKTIQRFN